MQHQVAKVWTAPAGAMGRAAANRLYSRNTDFAVVALYLPPNSSPDKQRDWQRTIFVLVKWLDELLRELPQRCAPVVCGDFNDAFGEQSRLLGIAGDFVQAS